MANFRGNLKTGRKKIMKLADIGKQILQPNTSIHTMLVVVTLFRYIYVRLKCIRDSFSQLRFRAAWTEKEEKQIRMQLFRLAIKYTFSLHISYIQTVRLFIYFTIFRSFFYFGYIILLICVHRTPIFMLKRTLLYRKWTAMIPEILTLSLVV